MESDSHEEEDDILDLTLLTDDRYARLRLINWWRQDCLAAAHVMVIGAGALGNEVLKNLALLGVGHIIIVDRDTIERSNLSRTVLFRESDIGSQKAEVAAERVRQLNPDVQAIALEGDITTDIGLGVFRRMDVVISCLDNRLARRAVNLACNRVRVPWVDGAIESLDGLVRVFSSRQPGTACYECALTAQDYQLLDLHYTCPPSTIRAAEGLSPTTPTAAAIIGALETQEAVKLLHDMETRLGCVTYFSGQTLRTTEMQYGYKADCPAHQTYNTIIELPTGTAHMTGGELLSTVADQVGEACFPLLPRTLLTVLTCPQCGHTEERYRPQLGQAQRGIPCAQCGAEYDFGRTNTVSPQGREADLPLTQIGFPPLAIIPFRGQLNTYLIELTGDVAEILPDTTIQSETIQSER